MKKNYQEHISNLFKNIQLFSSLTTEELSEVREKMEVKKFQRNEVILYEESTNQVMYIILQGKVKVIQSTQDGKEVILAMHRSGDFFGEMSLIDSKTIPAIVVAMEDSFVAILSKGQFYSLLYAQDKVLDVMLRIMCSRLRDSWERIQLLSFTNARQRIKMLFASLVNEYGDRTSEGTLLDIKLTHQNIADMTGVSRETVTRIIDRLHRDGEIKVLKNRSILLGRDFLNTM